MIKLFKYYFKSHLLGNVIISSIFFIMTFVFVSAAKYDGSTGSGNTPFSIFAYYAIVLTIAIPVYEFSFKMKKNSVDLHYSFPIKREKLYLTKFFVGLVEILIPILISYVLMLIMMIFKDNNIKPIYYLYFIGVLVLLITTLYAQICFMFTRGNTILDGLIFIGLYVFLGIVVISTIHSFKDYYKYIIDYSFLFPQSSIVSFANCLDKLAVGYSNPFKAKQLNTSYIFTLVFYQVIGVLAFVGFIFANKFEKAENSTDYSESWFGYKTLIPIYAVLLLITFRNSIEECILVLAATVIGYLIYNRGFKFPKYRLIPLIATSAICIILYLIMLAF